MKRTIFKVIVLTLIFSGVLALLYINLHEIIFSNINRIDVYKSMNFAKESDKIILSFADKDSIGIIKESVNSSKRINGILNTADPDYILDIHYSNGRIKILYLWLNQKSEKAMCMNKENTLEGYTISKENTSQLKNIFFPKDK